MKAHETSPNSDQSDVVITGYGVRLPQAENIAEFWQVLTDENCVISEIGEDRFSKEIFYHPDPTAKGKTYSVAAGQLDNIWKFDPAHFGISPREAEQMDPQQRLLLEVTSEAICEAGLTKNNWDRSRTGVYIGASSSDYSTGFAGDPDAIDAQFMVGNTLSIMSNRLAYVFDIKGPSYTVDTACSSSFFAMDQAVEALRSGKIDTAIVGAVNLLISPIPFVGFSRAAMLSPDGLCKAFDADANGYVRSEGAVVFVLRRMDVARQNRDHLRAVIHASAVNSDGRTVGLAMPSSQRQQELLCDIRAQYPFDLNDLAFVEAHGTGTAVGDPVEANALGNAFAKGRGTALPIGSAKSNFGHLEPASGLVGMLKSVLALEKGIYPASLHINNPNPHIDFEALNIALTTVPIALPDRNRPWLAGINSFGFGGANAHVILRQLWDHEKTAIPDIAPRNRNLALSAASAQGLLDLAAQYDSQILDHPSAAFQINNANYRREQYNHRLVALGETPKEIKSTLMAFVKGEANANLVSGQNLAQRGKVGFVFSGNGAQWPGMGRHLYRSSPDFRVAFDQVSELFKQKAGDDLAALMFDPEFETELGTSALVQPLAFAIQIALCDSLAKAGLTPDAVAGHSAGEVSAAYAAGILTLQSAVDLVHSRSSALATLLGTGGMAAVLAGAGPLRDALADFEDPAIVMSADNSTRSSSISGPIEALKEFAKFARKRRLAVKVLDIAYPFHSPAVDSIKDRLLNDLKGLQPAQGDCDYYSAAFGKLVDGPQMTADYWWQNTRNPVQFRAAVAAMTKDGCDIIVEISPKSILRNYVIDSVEEGRKVGFVSSLGPGQDAGISIDTIVAKAYVLGANISQSRFHGPEAAYFGSLPNMPWQHSDFCATPTKRHIDIYGRLGKPGLLGRRLLHDEGAWHNRIDIGKMPWLADHVVDGSVVFPATAFIDMALSAGCAEFGSDLVEISDLELLRPVVFEPNSPIDMRTSFESSANMLRIETRKANSDTDWELACFCTLRPNPNTAADISAFQGAPYTGLYDELAQTGLTYGPEFALVRHISVDGFVAQAELALPKHLDFTLDPRVADAAFHSLFALVHNATTTELPKGTIMVPASVGAVQLFKNTGEICRSVLTLKSLNNHGLVADIQLCDSNGRVCAQFSDLRLRAITLGANIIETPTWQQKFTRLSRAEQAPEFSKIAHNLGIFSTDEALNDAAILLDTAARSVAQQEMFALAHNHEIYPASMKNPALAQCCLELLAEDGLASLIDTQNWRLSAKNPYPDFDVLLAALIKKAPLYAVEMQELLRLSQNLGTSLTAPLFEKEPVITASDCHHAERWKWQAAYQILEPTIRDWSAGKRLNILILGHIPHAIFHDIAAHENVDQLIISDICDSNLARQKQHRQANGAVFLTLADLEKHSDIDLVVSVDGLFEANAANLRDVLHSMAPNGQLLIISEHQNALTRLTQAQTANYWDVKSLETGMPVPRHALGGDLVQKLKASGFSCVQTNNLDAEEAEVSLITAKRVTRSDANNENLFEWHNWDADSGDISRKKVVIEVGTSANSDGYVRFLDNCKTICLQKPAHLVIVHLRKNLGFAAIGRVLINEFPDIKIQILEIDQVGDMAEALSLLPSHPDEPCLLMRSGNLFAPRIQPGQNIVENPARGDAQRLNFTQAGQFQSLKWQAIERRAPNQDEVEIEVLATGLNFRDVMWAQGMLPPEALENGFAGAGLGMECVGKIMRVGDNARFEIGDMVMGFAPFAFSSHVTVDARVLGKVPNSLLPEAAAALPVAFLTALYGLEQMAQLQRGETVLIHGGAGGVGMAALQIANNLGATVIATAGTEEKRQLLRDLGAKWVLDSRSLSFAAEIMALTGGVDVVLNSLAGEAMERSLTCLKPFGRFVELGKRDFFANSRIGLRPFRKNLSYFGVDVDQLLAARPDMVGQLFQKLQAGFDSGAFAPPPCQVFEADEVADAFRLMQKSGHIGKIIIRAPRVALPAQAPEFSARDAWLIIGGTGGVGLATAKYLARNGAKKLWLVSRSGKLDIAGIDAEVEVLAADAADLAQMEQVFNRIAADNIPLRGVVHAAMVLDDALLKDQTPERMQPVLRSKIDIGLVLDQLCCDISLDHFVMFSSISTFFGNPGQLAYVAGNAALEGLIQQRRARGDAGNCVAFGPIADVGYLANKDKQRAFMQKQMGGRIMKIDAALDAFGAILMQNPVETVAVGPMAWGNMAADLALLQTNYFARIDLKSNIETSGAGGDLMMLVAGLNAADALAKAVELLRAEAAKVLLQPPEDIDADKPLTDLGFDSLMAMSLRMQAEENLGINLPLMALVDGLTLNQLAYKVLHGSGEQENMENQLIAQHIDANSVDPEIVKTVANAAQNVTSLTQKSRA